MGNNYTGVEKNKKRLKLSTERLSMDCSAENTFSIKFLLAAFWPQRSFTNIQLISTFILFSNFILIFSCKTAYFYI